MSGNEKVTSGASPEQRGDAELLDRLRIAVDEWTPVARSELGRVGQLHLGPPGENRWVRLAYDTLAYVKAQLQYAERSDANEPLPVSPGTASLEGNENLSGGATIHLSIAPGATREVVEDWIGCAFHGSPQVLSYRVEWDAPHDHPANLTTACQECNAGKGVSEACVDMPGSVTRARE